MTYESSTQHLLDELRRIELLLSRYGERSSGGSLRNGLDLPDGGDDVSDVGDVADLTYALDSSDAEAMRDRASKIETKCSETPEGVRLPLETLVDAFDLDDNHRDVLVLALLPDVDPAGGERFGAALNQMQLDRPTVGFVADLFAETPAEFVAALGLLGPDSPLVAHDLVTLDPPTDGPGASRLSYAVSVDDRVLSYLLGDDGVDERLQALVAEHTPTDVDEHLVATEATATLDDLLVSEDLRAELDELAATDDGARRVYVHGPRGAGMARAVEALCEADTYLQADLRAVLAAGALDALVREATILDRPLHLFNADAATFDDRETDHSLASVLDRFADFENDLFVTGRRQWTPSHRPDSPVDAIVAFDRPTIPLRREFWDAHADDLPDDLDPATMASTFDLTQGQLEAALATAETLAGPDGLTVEDVRAGCRAQSSGDLADLAQHVEPTWTWDDIELRETTERQLRTLESHVRNRGRIYDDWGFRERDGNAGVVALFKGLPGTGKTMAAEVLANAVGMDVFKIDLSSVVSKYIGETEENLERIFAAAEQSNAILLFDEADSIFGDRAEVSDATDRYANVEVNYLLQRVETYDGVIVLTTNFAQNIDTAFTRRITHTIHFETPSADTRADIWESIFPEDAPVEDLDTEWLATFDYSGGDIDKLAKHVAIHAADRDAETIAMGHVVEALEQYKRDQNERVREQDFEPYLEHLQGPTKREEKERRHQSRRP